MLKNVQAFESGQLPPLRRFLSFFPSPRRIPGRERAASAVVVKVGKEGDSLGGRLRPGAAAAVETAAEAADADAKEGRREGSPDRRRREEGPFLLPTLSLPRSVDKRCVCGERGAIGAEINYVGSGGGVNGRKWDEAWREEKHDSIK